LDGQQAATVFQELGWVPEIILAGEIIEHLDASVNLRRGIFCPSRGAQGSKNFDGTRGMALDPKFMTRASIDG
jgi:hypothetical protein